MKNLHPSLLNIPKKPKKLRKKLVVAAQVSLLLFATIVPPFINPPKASAWLNTTMPKCNTATFNTFNWKDKMKEELENLSTSDPYYTDSYNPDAAAAYVFYSLENDTEVKASIVMQTPKRFEMYRHTGSLHTGKYFMQLGIHPSEYQNPSWSHIEWEIDPLNKTVDVVGLVPSFNTHTYDYAPTVSTFDPQPFPLGGTSSGNYIQCIYSAKGLTYSPTYDGNIIDEGMPPQGTESCSITDLGCLIQKAFQGIDDTLSGVGQAILKGIGWLFMPIQDRIAIEIDAMNLFFTEKLGFISYPFTFTVDLWNAFLNPSSNWCTTESCVKNTGEFMGHDYTINFFKLNDVIPGAFVFMQNAIRAITILGLIHLARTKFSEVTQK